MRAPLAATLLALGLAIAFMAQAQQLYRWVDKDGHVHYTQQPPPREAAKSVESRRLSGSVVEAPKPYALEQATKNYPVRPSGSVSRAARFASSNIGTITAPSSGFQCSMRAIAASTSSAGVTARVRTSSAWAVASRGARSMRGPSHI